MDLSTIYAFSINNFLIVKHFLSDFTSNYIVPILDGGDAQKKLKKITDTYFKYLYIFAGPLGAGVLGIYWMKFQASDKNFEDRANFKKSLAWTCALTVGVYAIALIIDVMSGFGEDLKD